MKSVNLEHIIGSEILDIKYQYKYENEFGLQEFSTFIKLSNNAIIDIPIYDDNILYHLNNDNVEYYQFYFDSGKEFTRSINAKILSSKIEDILFPLNDNEINDDKRAYIKLNNGLYITENNYAPQGIEMGLIVLNKEELNIRVSQFCEELKSFKNTLKNEKSNQL